MCYYRVAALQKKVARAFHKTRYNAWAGVSGSSGQLLLEELNPEVRMATIRCDQHGATHEAFVCKHLVYGKYLGFFCDLDDRTNPYPDAWCNGCELIRLEHNGWTDATEELMEIALVCGGCYEEIKERNLLGSESSSALQ